MFASLTATLPGMVYRQFPRDNFQRTSCETTLLGDQKVTEEVTRCPNETSSMLGLFISTNFSLK